MLKRHGRVRHHLILFASAGRSIGDLAGGLWHSEFGKRWMVPLAVFLCIIGLVLTVAGTVEALAPFIYSIF
jgi:uncharacterized RDD family membrane protein YckC